MILFINKACCGKFELAFSTVTGVFLVIALDNGKYVSRVGYHQNCKEYDTVYLIRKLYGFTAILIKKCRTRTIFLKICLQPCSDNNT